MNVTTVIKKKIDRKNGIVILPLKEYERLKEQAIPTYYLTGKTARALDTLVEEGLKEHRAGRTRKVRSLAELD